MAEAGRGALPTPRDPRSQEVPSPDGRVGPAQPHRALLRRAKTSPRSTPRDIERYIVVKRKTLATKTVRNHLNTIHSVFEIGPAPHGLVPEQPRRSSPTGR